MSTHQRLSVNINEESAEILRSVTRERGITTTEAIRRAIALLGFFEAARRADTTLWSEDKKGEKTQLHVV
ncbi:hypothetical protein GCM10025792_37850 [Pseudonocardia tropica]|uniref:ribbon-helix-helix protein, CopG family n=1 Tax=Pseudonocardia tropica TaxID=681289 RepID=UPI003382E2DC